MEIYPNQYAYLRILWQLNSAKKDAKTKDLIKQVVSSLDEKMKPIGQIILNRRVNTSEENKKLATKFCEWFKQEEKNLKEFEKNRVVSSSSSCYQARTMEEPGAGLPTYADR